MCARAIGIARVKNEREKKASVDIDLRKPLVSSSDLESRKGRMVFYNLRRSGRRVYVGLPDRSYHPTIGPFEYRGQIGGPDRPRLSSSLAAYLNISLLRKAYWSASQVHLYAFAFFACGKRTSQGAPLEGSWFPILSWVPLPSRPLCVLSSSIKPLDNATRAIDPSKGAWEYCRLT